MSIEVELKFRDPDLDRLRAGLEALGATAGTVMSQSDTYYSHPVRDFSETDEALRIRQVGEQNCMTYKGARIDTHTKTRQELEVGLAAGSQAASTLSAISPRVFITGTPAKRGSSD